MQALSRRRERCYFRVAVPIVSKKSVILPRLAWLQILPMFVALVHSCMLPRSRFGRHYRFLLLVSLVLASWRDSVLVPGQISRRMRIMFFCINLQNESIRLIFLNVTRRIINNV